MWLLCKVIQCLLWSSFLGDGATTPYTMLQLCCHPKVLKDPFKFYDLITVLYQTAYYQKIILFQTIRVLIKSRWFASTFVVLVICSLSITSPLPVLAIPLRDCSS